MKRYINRPSTAQSGFSLVEIMVAMVVGLLATMVIMQVLSVFELQKRTTTGTADAQTNGSISLFNISRDLQMAGYPLVPVKNSALDCVALTVDGIAGFNHTSLSPVTIVDGPVSDTITIRYGNSFSGGSPGTITAVGAPGPNDITLNSNLGCQVGDVSLITSGFSCALSKVTAVAADDVSVTLDNPAGAVPNANLACLGDQWMAVTYDVTADGNLQRNGEPLIAGIVNLQAQYGVSLNVASNTVALWVDATGPYDAATITQANRNLIKAVRIAVVGRSAKREMEVVTPGPVPAWSGPGAPAVDLTGYGTDWDHYRYRAFDTIIPLRNVIWAKGTLQ